jgi:hypothetical protein
MTTQNKENYGRDVRSFHHPEDDMKVPSDINNYPDPENKSYVDQYEKDNNEEEIVNQDDDIINNEDDDELNNHFSNLKKNDDQKNNPDANFYADEWDNQADVKDIDDDFEEDYDENDRYVNKITADNQKKDLLDLEYDIDEDLEETDPVNNPRSFKY